MTAARVFTPAPGSTVYLAPMGQGADLAQWTPIGMVADECVDDAHLGSDHASGMAVDLAAPMVVSFSGVPVEGVHYFLPRPSWWRRAWGELLDRAVYYRGRLACVVLGRHTGPICRGRTDHRPHVATWGDRLRQRLGLATISMVAAWWLLRRWFGW